MVDMLTVCIIIIHDDVDWFEYDTYIKVENVCKNGNLNEQNNSAHQKKKKKK